MAQKFADLNVSNTAILAKARAMGFSDCRRATVIQLNSQKDLNLLRCSEGGLLCVESQNGELLRAACKNKNSALINALAVQGFSRDDGLIRAVAENEKAFEIPLSALVLQKHVFRAKAISQLKEFARRCNKLGAKMVFTSRAKEEWDLKSPREIIAIASLLGLSREQAAAAIGKNAMEIIERREGERVGQGERGA